MGRVSFESSFLSVPAPLEGGDSVHVFSLLSPPLSPEQKEMNRKRSESLVASAPRLPL